MDDIPTKENDGFDDDRNDDNGDNDDDDDDNAAVNDDGATWLIGRGASNQE